MRCIGRVQLAVAKRECGGRYACILRGKRRLPENGARGLAALELCCVQGYSKY